MADEKPQAEPVVDPPEDALIDKWRQEAHSVVNEPRQKRLTAKEWTLTH